MDFLILGEIIRSWLVLIVFLHLIMLKKFKPRVNEYISFSITTVIIVMMYYYLHFTELSMFTELYILAALVILLYNIFFKGKFFQVSFSCIMLLQFFVLSRIWMFIIYHGLEVLAEQRSSVHQVIEWIDFVPYFSRNIIFVLLSSWLYSKINSKYFSFDYLYENKKLLNSCLIFSLINYNVLLYLFLTYTQLKSNGTVLFTIIVISMASLIFLVFLVSLLRVLSEKSYTQFSLNTIEEQLKIQFNHYKNLESYMTKSRVIVHDTKHHILALDSLLENERYVEAKHYLDKVKEDLFLLEKNKICQNKVVDAILNSIRFNCEEQQIDFICDVVLPEEITIDHFDLAIIFGNLLNNALEACEGMTDENIKKFISISAKIINNQIVIRIRNSTTNQLINNGNGLFKTTKDDKVQHGIGLLSVKSSVNKYDGSIQFKNNNQVFEVILMMKGCA